MALRPVLILAAAALAAGGAAPPVSAAAAAAPQASLSPSFAAIAEHFRAQVEADAFSGAVLIAQNGRTVFERGYGLANGATGERVTPDTKFNLASIDKFITRIAIFQLLERGKLRLDDKVGAVLPDHPNREVRDKVTVGQLVFMKAGIPNFWNERYRAARRRLRTTDDYLALFADEPLRFEPGSRGEYSNGGYILLGKIVERLSGLSYPDYVRRNITKPAGMRDTGPIAPGARARKIAFAYTHGGRERRAASERPRWATAEKRDYGSAAGGGFSTVRDFARLDAALRAGKLLKAQGAELLLGKDFRSGNAPAVGWAGGSDDGASTQFAMLADGTTIIVFTNRDEGLAEKSVRKIAQLLGKQFRGRGPYAGGSAP